MDERISWRAIVKFAIYTLVLPLVLFAAAGRLNWLMGWAYFAVHVSFTVISRLIAFYINPDLLAERAQSMHDTTVKQWDRLLVLLVAILGPLAVWIVAGLDLRFGWSLEIPQSLQIAGLVVVALGYIIGTWAMAVNAFFSAYVRIQKDRSQVVVNRGPYRWVRHPAYIGGIVSCLAMPVMLDSLWAMIPAGLIVMGICVRTFKEDRLLHEELPGYSQYARQTRFRLFPGIW